MHVANEVVFVVCAKLNINVIVSTLGGQVCDELDTVIVQFDLGDGQHRQLEARSREVKVTGKRSQRQRSE